MGRIIMEPETITIEEEIYHWEQLKLSSIACIEAIQNALGDSLKRGSYIEEYGEIAGDAAYTEWRRRAKGRLLHEKRNLADIKAKLRLLNEGRVEVVLLRAIYYAIEPHADLTELRHQLWVFLTRRHKIRLTKEQDYGNDTAGSVSVDS